MKTRVCSICKKEKELEKFGKNKSMALGYAYQCKPCHNRRVNDRHRFTRYGVTSEQFKEMLTKQDNLCAICRKVSVGCRKGSDLCIDHCHTTGRVRGLVCKRCNVVIGKIYDDPLIAQRLVEYLS